jgi:hypothetical protein
MSLLCHPSVCLSACPILYTASTSVYLFLCLPATLSVCLPSIPHRLIYLSISLCVCLLFLFVPHSNTFLIIIIFLSLRLSVCVLISWPSSQLLIHVLNGQYVLACYLCPPSHPTIHQPVCPCTHVSLSREHKFNRSPNTVDLLVKIACLYKS